MSEYFSIFLTHRHGAGIFLYKENHQRAKVELTDIEMPIKLSKKVKSLSPFFRKLYHQSYDLIREKKIEKSDSIEFLSHKDFLLSRSLGRTAESLLSLYENALKKLNINDNQVKKIIFGTGPGSFTGLRLGASFVQGLVLGGGKRVYEIPTLLYDDLVSYSPSHSKDEIDTQLCLRKSYDPSSGQITFYDILYSITELEKAFKQEKNNIVLNYGRESTPVLRLTKQ